MQYRRLAGAMLLLGCGLASSLAHSGTLNFANWADYAAKDTFANFEKQTGIKVNFDPFDSEETLQTKLLVGKSSLDVAVPSSGFLRNQLQAGLYQKLDKSKLPNWDKLDKGLMKQLEVVDPGNQYAIPWAWGTSGLAINVTKVKQILGASAPLDSWALLFDPKYSSKLKQCGIGLLESPADVVAAMLKYQHKDPSHATTQDVQDAFAQLRQIRPYITQINSSSYVSDLALGDICLALGWSGDVLQARLSAKESKRSDQIEYVVPKEGSVIWFDVMVIPKEAPHLDAAYKWLNYIETPQVHAEISNAIFYLSANKAANDLVRPAIRNDPAVNPSEVQRSNLSAVSGFSPDLLRLMNRLWSGFKSGR
ncbi:polyamine ABC transporter substrate-binding protein [Vogesella sp. LIG4]|uniref:polyamine ABC transporter substrate-binding protein n=1 Tax=Vogesella sp. LIG4 TaxID=1192162 RepID=UPI00081FDD48|nr:polyamine ABC transporter substrate-binding protein [Vogesella sp. LIG4]SCK29797.1 putrescine transport system substrate-binding protein [Vogesella sp. LIG4]